jgi:hypothetical protein
MTGLFLGLQLSAFGFQFWAMAPDADIAVAVAVGLARAEHGTIEVPVSVEVAAVKPSATVDLRAPRTEAIEWVRTCDQYGCRLMPRMPPGAARPPSAASQGPAATDSSTPGDEQPASAAEGGRWRARRFFFGRGRLPAVNR